MFIKHRGHEPEVHPTAWVAPNATLVGNVRVGPRARIMYGAVLDAEGSRISIGEACVIAEHAVLRATAIGDEERPVLVGDHVLVGPHATVLGCTVSRCAYLAASATVLHGARVGAGACVAVGALVHARSVVPAEFFVPPNTVADVTVKAGLVSNEMPSTTDAEVEGFQQSEGEHTPAPQTRLAG